MVGGMAATTNAGERGTSAPSLVFQNELYDAAAAAKGAETEEARARLCDVDRATLYRYRTGRTMPLLDAANRFAAYVDLTAADLWKERAA